MKCPFCIKKCNKCGKLLVAYNGNFCKQKSGKYGLRSDCKQCKSKYAKEHRKENLEQIREKDRNRKRDRSEYHKKWYEEHKEEQTEKKKQYYEKHKKEIKEKGKIYRDSHKEEISEINRKYRKNNFDKIKEYKKQWCKENPDKIFNSSNKRRIKKENQGKGISQNQWYEMMEFFDWKCAYSGESIANKKDRSIDHIIPISKNGLNEIWNCIPCYSPYNKSKHNKDMLEWYVQQPFFSEERLNKIYEWVEYAKNKWNK